MVQVLTKRRRAGMVGALLALTLGLAACGSQSPAPEVAAEQPVASADAAAPDDAELEALQLGAGSDLSLEPFVSVTNGWGPVERNLSNGEKAAGDGRALTIGGRTYARGLGVHASSSLTFDLGGRCSTFTSAVGVDDEVSSRGSVVFQVYADGVKLYDSGVLRGSDGARALSVNVSGRRELRLVVTDAGDGVSSDHADWASPSLLGCAAAPSAAPVSAPAGGEPVYAGPITITRGGTYSGNWESLDTTPVITIQTSEPVIIENSRIRGGGRLITGWDYDLTVRNVRGEARTPGQAGRSATRVVAGENIRNLRVENSTFSGGGIYVRSFKGTGDQGIRILRNTFRNIDGRQSDGRGGYNGQTNIMQAIQFNAVQGIANAEIAWNQVINEPGQSAVEDNINLYASSGTPDKPILIHDNYIQGAYPADPTSKVYSGGGIMLGDAKVTDPRGNGYVRAYDNQIVGTTNYGLAIAGGVGIEAYRNRVVGSGRLPDGSRLPAQNVGIYVWDIYGAGNLAPATFAGNSLRDNVSGWTKVGADGKTSTNPMWLPHCGYRGTTCANNVSLGKVTPASEAAELVRWQQKLGDAGVRVGAQ